MGTKRRPINRPARPRISDEALAIFSKMRRIECTCRSGSLGDCRGCKRWEALHEQLADALRWQPETWQIWCIPGLNRDWRDELAEVLESELEAALAARGMEG
jgi:hypothetical protein